MVIENQKCRGFEKSISECGGNFQPKCGPQMSAMMKCEGDGDSSGFINFKKNVHLI